jgi:hypothetical protein
MREDANGFAKARLSGPLSTEDKPTQKRFTTTPQHRPFAFKEMMNAERKALG